MAYTTHGHHIPNTDAAHFPLTRARCGGPKICTKCALEAAQYQATDTGPARRSDLSDAMTIKER